MAKITEQERSNLLAMSYEDGKEEMYQVLLQLAEQERIAKEAKEKIEWLNSKRDSLYESILSKASEEEKEMKKIFSDKMILQENQIAEKKIDLGKVSDLIKNKPEFKNGIIKMLENKKITLSAPTRIVKEVNAYAGSTIVSLDDIQSLQTKKEVILAPMDLVAADELE